MLKKVCIGISAAFVGFLFLSSICQVSRAAEGFIKLADAKLPPAVLEASRAVFKIVYESPYANPGEAPLTTYATGFVAGRPDTLITVRHLVDDIVSDWKSVPANEDLLDEEIQKSGPLALTELIKSGRLPLRFRLIDRDGKTVFSNQEITAEPAKVMAYFDPTAFLQDIYNSSLFWTETGDGLTYEKSFSDTVILRLPLSLPVVPLELKALSKTDSPLFAIGFPVKTLNRTHNSDGEAMQFSRGLHMNTQEALTKAGRKKILSNTQVALLEQAFFYTDIDVLGGNSGSPVFTEDGAVAGMVFAMAGLKMRTPTGFKLDYEAYHDGVGAVVVSTPWIKTLGSITDIEGFRNIHREVVDRALVKLTETECPSRLEKAGLITFLHQPTTKFPSKSVALENLLKSNQCTVNP